jgi:adenylate kinase
VEDSIVIDLVKKQVEQFEKEHTSWVIEGFPRTKVQALALQKSGIIPDRFILLNVEREASLSQVKNNLIAAKTAFSEEELEQVAE